MASDTEIVPADALFEVAKLFQITNPGNSPSNTQKRTASSPSISRQTASRATPPKEGGSPNIQLSTWYESEEYTVLILYISNGYFIFKVHSNSNSDDPVLRQIQWFQSQEHSIMDMCLGPKGEWLACCTLNGCVTLVPVTPLLMGWCPAMQYAPLDDVEILRPPMRISSPTSVVWWETLDLSKSYIITGSEIGEILLFDLRAKKSYHIATLNDCINSLQVLSDGKSCIYLLICLRGSKWMGLLLEQNFATIKKPLSPQPPSSGRLDVQQPSGRRSRPSSHSQSSSHPSSPTHSPNDSPQIIRSGSGSNHGNQDNQFEVLNCSITILNKTPDISRNFEPFKLKFNELYQLKAFKVSQLKSYLGAYNMKSNVMEVYPQDLHITDPIFVYHLPLHTSHFVITERVLYALCHEDDSNRMSLQVLSTQKAKKGSVSIDSKRGSVENEAQNEVLFSISFPAKYLIKGIYPISHMWNPFLVNQPYAAIRLDGCVMVTEKMVYHIRQKGIVEELFLQSALRSSDLQEAEDLAVAYNLDVYNLYKIVAEKKLEMGEYESALNTFIHFSCSVTDVVDILLTGEHFKVLLDYIIMVRNHGDSFPKIDEEWLSTILLNCYIQQLLVNSDNSNVGDTMSKARQHLIDDFHIDASTVLKTFFKHGLINDMLDYAKAKGVVPAALTLLVNSGCLAIDHQQLVTLVTSQYVSIVASVGGGILLQVMPPDLVIKVFAMNPSLITKFADFLRERVPHYDAAVLLQLVELLDPSQSTIRPLLLKAISQPRQRSSSTGSIVSILSDSSIGISGDEPQIYLHVLLELFLTCFIYMRYKRLNDPLKSQSQENIKYTGHHGNQLLACGRDHTAFVHQPDNTLFTWGSRSNGKLGQSEMNFEGSQPSPLIVSMFVEFRVPVSSVACGWEHTLILSLQKEVYSWGANTCGQLGHGDLNSRSHPVQIAHLADKHIVQIASGHYHCLAVTDNHQVWAWGSNEWSQLGLGEVTADQDTPTHVALLDAHKVAMVAAGNRHSVVVSKLGKLLTFGSSSHGQLGHGNLVRQNVPKVVDHLKDHPIHLVSCGSFHTMVVTKRGTIFMFGKNNFGDQESLSQSFFRYKSGHYGNKTTPISGDFLVPAAVPQEEVEQPIAAISSGSTHSLLLTKSGGVYSWGTNAHGQLGLENIASQPHFRKITILGDTKVAMVACGEEYSTAVDEHGNLWSWGRGDMGQLGVEPEQTASSKKRRPSRDSDILRIYTPKIVAKFSPKDVTQARSRSPILEGEEKEVELAGQEVLDWNLPNLKLHGAVEEPYSQEALNTALTKLYGNYRVYPLIKSCHDCKDWLTLGMLYDLERQPGTGLEFHLMSLTDDKHKEAEDLVERSLQYLSDVWKDNTPEDFKREAVIIISTAVDYWCKMSLSLDTLEAILLPRLPDLAHAIYDVVSSSQNGKQFSLKFKTVIAQHIMTGITCGKVAMETYLKEEELSLQSVKLSKDVGQEVVGDHALNNKGVWDSIQRNLSKDLTKSQRYILLSNEAFLQSVKEKQSGFILFTCGHAYTDSQMALTLSEFETRMKTLPQQNQAFCQSLLRSYRNLQYSTMACPRCVFQQIRKQQLIQFKDIAIKPWT